MMRRRRLLVRIGSVALLLLMPVLASAQFGAGYGPPLVTEPPPIEFETSGEHYAWLLEQAGGGTMHTLASVPRWDGLWNTAGRLRTIASTASTAMLVIRNSAMRFIVSPVDRCQIIFGLGVADFKCPP
jgi:hypothetical protein